VTDSGSDGSDETDHGVSDSSGPGDGDDSPGGDDGATGGDGADTGSGVTAVDETLDGTPLDDDLDETPFDDDLDETPLDDDLDGTPFDETALDNAVAAGGAADSGAAAWRIGPRRLRRVGLLAVGCVVAGVGLAVGYGQPPLVALFRGSVLGVFAFLLLTAALFVYWSVRQTMAR